MAAVGETAMTLIELARTRHSMMILREDAFRLCREVPDDKERSALAFAYATASLRLLAEIIEMKVNGA